MTNTKTKILNFVIPIFTLFCILVFWELSIDYFQISPIVLIKPSQILPSIFQNFDIITKEIKFTFTQIIYGWIWGSMLAIVLSVITYRFSHIAKILISSSVVINSIPLIALAAILGGIVGTNIFGKTVIVALLCFFPMFITTQSSFVNIESGYLSLMKTYSASQKQILRKIIFPKSLPYIFNALKINVVTAIFAGVVGEFFGAHGGIGNFILTKKGMYNLALVWSAIFYLIIASLIFYLLVVLLAKLFVPWRN